MLCTLSTDAAAAVVELFTFIAFINLYCRPLWSMCRCSLFHCLFRLSSFLWPEEVIQCTFPSLFLVFPLVCLSDAWCRGKSSILLLSFPIVHLVAMQFSLPRRHVILLCVSIQHGMLAAFILSIAIAMLLSMYSFHSSSSISPASISSSESFMKEMSMSWSQSVFELLPSAFSSDENVAFTFSSS